MDYIDNYYWGGESWVPLCPNSSFIESLSYLEKKNKETNFGSTPEEILLLEGKWITEVCTLGNLIPSY